MWNFIVSVLQACVVFAFLGMAVLICVFFTPIIWSLGIVLGFFILVKAFQEEKGG